MSALDTFGRSHAAEPPSYRASIPFGAGAAVLVATFLINTLAISGPLAALLIYDQVLPNDARSTLAILAVGVIALVVAEAVLRLIRAAILSRASAHADFVARNRVIGRILRGEAHREGRMALSELNGRLSAVGAMRELRFARFTAIVDLPFGLAFLLLVGAIGGWTVALPAGACLTFLLAVGIVAFANERALRDLQHADRRRWGFVETASSRLHGIAAIASGVSVTNGFVRRQLARAGTQKRQAFLDLLSRDVMTTFSQVLISSVLVAGALAVLREDLSLGGLAACTLLAGRALEPLQNCLRIISLSRRARVARDDLAALGRELGGRATGEIWSNPPEIRFDEAGIATPGGGRPLVSAGNIAIRAGEIVTISGDRGTGKTALGLSLLGMASVTGSLRVGGIDVTTPEAATIRCQAGYIPRLPQLPSGRLLDILTDGSETLYADVRYLAHLVGLDETVKRLPAGYDTVLRAGSASELPAGVRQQVAICRVLAKKHKLIVADDATCILDAATELRFAKVLKMLSGEATVVLLTDRPSLRNIAARRFDLTGGRLIAQPSVIEGRT